MTNQQRRVTVQEDEVRATVSAVFAAERAGPPDVGVALVDDETIHALNREHLDHDWPTDVIAFDYGEDPAPDELRGEVVASAETAAREAAERGLCPRRELLLYVAHGTLHLLGWDDDTPDKRQRMNARAAAILDLISLGEEAP